MNNSNERRNKNRSGYSSGHGGKNSHNYNKSGSSGKNWNNRKNRQNNQHSKGGKRHFQKFVDTEHMNYESNNWPQNQWNYDTNKTNDYHFNEPVSGDGIYPWIRSKPANNLLIPQHINFDEQCDRILHDRNPNIVDPVQQKEHESIATNHEAVGGNKREISVPKTNENTEVTKPSSEVQQQLTTPINTNTSIKIKKEKDLLLNLKQEKKSNSSSSSSESSSSEDEPHHNIKATAAVKPEIITKPPSSPLNIKLKPRTNSVSSNTPKMTEKCKSLIENASSSSTSSSSDEKPQTPKADKKRTPQSIKKSGSSNKKVNSEDDVVCVGNVENKIVLEDESENSSSSENQPENEITTTKVTKETSKKSVEKCMICAKSGHTSFQCQMICKNCSAPYHGYRTCPHPANLNTMMQLFIEFCMQQLQNFQVEKHTNASDCNNVPKPKVDSPVLTTNIASKSNKIKRKQKVNKKNSKSKKRKVSSSKKTKSKASNDASGDSSSEDDSDTETSASETDEQLSDSSAISLVSSKKKRKLKSASASKPALDLSSFSTNSVGLPMVLNGFPHLTVPTTSTQSQNPSTNALNTLLLTQMFQNAIGSLKQ